MIRDWALHGGPLDERFDVCVVGSGAVGLPLALALARRGRRVLVLEAGDAVADRSPQDAVRGVDLGPDHHAGLNEGRFRGLGGTTNLWGGQIHPLDAIDLSRRDWVDGSGWPIDRAELDPFFEEALELEGIPRVLRDDDEVWKRLRVVPPASDVDGLELYFTRWCRQPAFATLHADEIRRSERLVILTNAPVVDLELSGDRVSGLVCRRQDGVEQTFTAPQIALCLGGIETVRFFLQPLRGARAPWTDHPLLGASFQDHIDVDGASVVPRDGDRFARLFSNAYLGGLKYHPKLRLAPAVQARERVLNVAGTMVFDDGDGGLGHMKRVVRRAMAERRPPSAADLAVLASGSASLARPAWHYLVRHRAHHPADAPVSLRVHSEQEPLGASRISLTDERDRFGVRRAQLSWHVSDLELRTIETFVRVTAAALARRGLATVHPSADLGSPAMAARCEDASHHMSGMRMATDRATGLVDPDLRVFGTSNLYVCGSAVFPTSGCSNPTHTAIALAMRLAHRLSGGPLGAR